MEIEMLTPFLLIIIITFIASYIIGRREGYQDGYKDGYSRGYMSSEDRYAELYHTTREALRSMSDEYEGGDDDGSKKIL